MELDPTPEAAAEQLAEQKRNAAIARSQELNDLAVVMRLKEGRRFIWRFLSAAGIFRNCADQSNVYTTYWREGRRELALAFYQEIIEHHPDLYLAMCREARIPISAGTAKQPVHGSD